MGNKLSQCISASFGPLVASAVLFAPAQAAILDAAASEADCQQASKDCVAQGRWNFSLSLGAGVRTNPLLQGRDIPLVVIPQFSYYGRRFFIDNLDLGLTLEEGNSNSLSLVASPGYDRVFFYRSDLQNIFVSGFAAAGAPPRVVPPDTAGAVQFPPRPRRVTYLSGPEWTFKYQGITGQLDLLHEITGQNHGNEIRAALRIPLVESQVSFAANIGVTWKNAAIVNYYYGEPNFYQAGSSLDPFLKLKFARPLGGKWQFNAFVEYEQLGKAIANSPIVMEDHVVTCFIGATYTH
jgi:outer membrane protein